MVYETREALDEAEAADAAAAAEADTADATINCISYTYRPQFKTGDRVMAMREVDHGEKKYKRYTAFEIGMGEAEFYNYHNLKSAVPTYVLCARQFVREYREPAMRKKMERQMVPGSVPVWPEAA